VAVLIDAKADSEAQDKNGHNPLMLAARSGEIACIALLADANTIATQRPERKRRRASDASTPRDERQ